MSTQSRTAQPTLLDPAILVPAIGQAFRKLDPRLMVRNPVMFVVEVVAALTTVLALRSLAIGGAGFGFNLQIILWLWVTVLFANFAEAVAEGRGKAQAATLRRARPQAGRRRAGRGRRSDPLRRRGGGGHRFGRRERDHRRVGPGHP
ncbi:MAG: hypothetical protein J0H99_22035 [Rhodospirillales bacterium]|nr:hypothetical protein [Rhodospirillales bacterium]